MPCATTVDLFFFCQTSGDNDYCTFFLAIWYALLNENSRGEKKRLTRQRSIWRRLLSLNRKLFFLFLALFVLCTMYRGQRLFSLFCGIRNGKNTLFVLLGFSATYSKRKTVNSPSLRPLANAKWFTFDVSIFQICGHVHEFRYLRESCMVTPIHFYDDSRRALAKTAWSK